MKALILSVCACFGLAIFQGWGSKAASTESGSPAKMVRTSFVDGKNGVDTKDCGSEQKPCKKIQYAINNANKTEEIIIKVKASGIYDERIIIENINNITLLGGDKAADPKPTLKAQKERATISIKGTNITIKGFEITNGDKFLAGNGKDQTAISVEPGSKIINILNNNIHTIGQVYGKEGCCIKNGELITNCPCSGQAHAINVRNYTADEVSKVFIIGNTISNLHLGQSEAIAINGNVSDFLVEDNTIHNVDNIAIDIAGNFGDCDKESNCHAQATNGRVIHNDVSYVYADQKKSANTPTTDRCNRKTQYNPGQGNNAHTMGAIYVDGGTNVIIERNKVSCSATGIDFGSEEGATVDNIIVKNNVVYNNYFAGLKIGNSGNKTLVNNSRVFNNTFVNDRRDPNTHRNGVIYFENSDEKFFENISIANNIVIVEDLGEYLITNAKGKAAFKNNLFFSTNKANFSNDAKGEAFDIFKDWNGNALNVFLAKSNSCKLGEFLTPKGACKPLFTDFNNGDFNLLGDSFAIDKGDSSFFANCKDTDPNCLLDRLGNKRIVNGMVDIGAFELQK
jgi:hypothetical protein